MAEQPVAFLEGHHGGAHLEHDHGDDEGDQRSSSKTDDGRHAGFQHRISAEGQVTHAGHREDRGDDRNDEGGHEQFVAEPLGELLPLGVSSGLVGAAAREAACRQYYQEEDSDALHECRCRLVDDEGAVAEAEGQDRPEGC